MYRKHVFGIAFSKAKNIEEKSALADFFCIKSGESDRYEFL